MTEAEIMKALECHKEREIDNCSDCPYFNIDGCAYEMSKDALDLINRKNAEIEEYKERFEMLDSNSQMAIGYADALEERARAEAIKEFAERVKEKAKPHYFDNCNFAIPIDDIDQIAKEMGVEL